VHRLNDIAEVLARGIYFDALHIITANCTRQEIRLFERGGSAEGKLLSKKDEPEAKVSANAPYQLMNCAVFGHYPQIRARTLSHNRIKQIANNFPLF
jgi:hypothetical protein